KCPGGWGLGQLLRLVEGADGNQCMMDARLGLTCLEAKAPEALLEVCRDVVGRAVVEVVETAAFVELLGWINRNRYPLDRLVQEWLLDGVGFRNARIFCAWEMSYGIRGNN